MAITVGAVRILLDVDTGRMSKFSSAASTVARESSRMRSAAVTAGNEISSAFNKAGSAAAVLTGHLGGFGARLRGVGQVINSVDGTVAALGVSLAGAAVGLTSFLQSADKMRRMENNLRTVTSGMADLADVQKSLFDITQESRSELEGTVTLYARMARAADGLGFSQKNLLRITQTVQKSFAIGGATPQEAAGAAIQLAQGIASNRFSGDEFRSVSENAPVLLRAMADQLGVNIGKLREMAHAGELTGEVVMKAILGAGQAIDEQFGKTVPTVFQGLAKVKNSVDQYVYSVDRTYGITNTLSNSLVSLADNFEAVAYWGGVVGQVLGGALLGRLLVSGGRGTAGLFSLKEAKERVAQIKAETYALEKQRKEIQSQIKATEMARDQRLVDMRLNQTNALASTRNNVIASQERLNGLVKDRTAMMGRLKQIQSDVVAQLVKEQAATRQLVATRSSQLKAAERRLSKAGTEDNLAAVEEARRKLDAAKAQLAKDDERLATARSNVLATVVPKSYSNEIKTLEKSFNDLSKARERYNLDVAKGNKAVEDASRLAEERVGIEKRLASAQTAAHSNYIGYLKAERDETLKAINRQVSIGGKSSELAKLQDRYRTLSDNLSTAQKITFDPKIPASFLREVKTITSELDENARKLANLRSLEQKGISANTKIATILKEQEKLTERMAAVHGRAFESAKLGEYGNEIRKISAEAIANHKAQIAANQQLVRAQREYVAAQQLGPAVAAKARAEIERTEAALSRLRQQAAMTNDAYAKAVTNLEKATRQATLLGAAVTRVRNFFSGFWNLIGRGPGAALSAALITWGMIETSIMNSKRATDDWKQSLREAGFLADDVADSASKIDKAVETKNLSQLRELLRQNNEEMEKLKQGGFWTRLLPGIFGSERGINQIARDVERRLVSSQLAAKDFTQNGIEPPAQFTSDIADYQRFLDILDAVKEANVVTAEQNQELQELANKHQELDPLLNELRSIVTVLEAGSQNAERLGKAIDDASVTTNLPSGFIDRPFVEDPKIAETRKAFDKFKEDRLKKSGLTPELKEIHDRTEAIIKAAEQAKIAITDAYRAEAEAQANAEIAAEKAVKKAEGLKDLRLDALAGRMDEWNQKIVQTARSLGVTREELEAYINAVTSGDLSKVPAIFSDIAKAMEQASENSLLKSLKDVRLDSAVVGLSEIDKQLVEIAKSAGMSYENVKALIDALQSGDYSGISKTLQELRLAMQAGATARLTEETMFERSQIFRSDKDREIASRLRGAGLPIDLNSDVAEAIRENLNWEELKNNTRSFFSDFQKKLTESGGDIGEAFAYALQNSMLKWADKIWDEVADAFTVIIGKAFGLSTGTADSSGAGGGIAAAVLGGAGAANDNRIQRSPLLAASDMAPRFLSGIGSPGGAIASAGPYSVANATAFIRDYAASIGIDPDIALRVARSEGLGAGIWQSNYVKNGFREPSYGPFQLLKGGPGTGFGRGLGNAFMAKTGLDPADPANWQQSTAFALDQARANGWGAWFGAKKQGITGFMGIDQSVEKTVSALDKLSTSSIDTAQSLTGGLGKLGSSLAQATPAAGAGGGGGGLFGWLGGLFGGGGGVLSGIGRASWAGGFAKGTENAPPGWAWVGEEGPELMRLRGGEVIRSHSRSVQMAREGSSVQVVVPDIRVYVDQDGNWQAKVEQIATRPAREESIRAIGNYAYRQSNGGAKADDYRYQRLKRRV